MRGLGAFSVRAVASSPRERRAGRPGGGERGPSPRPGRFSPRGHGPSGERKGPSGASTARKLVSPSFNPPPAVFLFRTGGDVNRLKFINTVKFYCISCPQDLYPGGGEGGPADSSAPSDFPVGHVAAGTLASGARPRGSRAGRDGTARSTPPAPSDGRSRPALPPLPR